MVDARTGDVPVLAVLTQALVHLVSREQLSKDVAVCPGAKISYAGQEIKCLNRVRNGESVGFKLSKQLVAFFEFLRILHASPFVAQ